MDGIGHGCPDRNAHVPEQNDGRGYQESEDLTSGGGRYFFLTLLVYFINISNSTSATSGFSRKEIISFKTLDITEVCMKELSRCGLLPTYLIIIYM